MRTNDIRRCNGKYEDAAWVKALHTLQPQIGKSPDNMWVLGAVTHTRTRDIPIPTQWVQVSAWALTCGSRSAHRSVNKH